MVWFLLKTYAVVLVVFWVRGTFPRLRIDQLMAFAWKVMVPLSFYTVIIAAVYRFYELPWWSLTIMSAVGLAVCGVDHLPAHDRAGPPGRRSAAATRRPPCGNRSTHLDRRMLVSYRYRNPGILPW